MPRLDWPDCWDWELELTPHLLKRIVDRRFTEVELRLMLERASNFGKDIVKGRWIINTRHLRRRRHVIVEPDYHMKLLVVITAYPLENQLDE